MLQLLKLLRMEKVVNIKELQKSPSRHLIGMTRILRGKKTIGYFFDNEAFEDILEDIEAFFSPAFRRSIKESRKRNKLYSIEEVQKRYGVTDDKIRRTINPGS